MTNYLKKKDLKKIMMLLKIKLKWLSNSFKIQVVKKVVGKIFNIIIKI